MSGIILDVIIVVVAVLLLIFGIWRGMYKLIFGLVSSLLAIALTVILVGTVSGFLVEKTTLDERLTTALSEPLNKAFPNGDVIISYQDIDGDGTSELIYTEGNEVHPLSDLFAGTNYALFGNVLSSVVAGHVEEGAEISFVNALSATIVAYIITAIVFIVLLIVFALLVKILMFYWAEKNIKKEQKLVPFFIKIYSFLVFRPVSVSETALGRLACKGKPKRFC